MENEFNPVNSSNIVSMFNLKALTLQDASHFNSMEPTFSYGFDEDEVVTWFQETNAKYAEVAAKYQRDWDTFTGKVDTEVTDY